MKKLAILSALLFGAVVAVNPPEANAYCVLSTQYSMGYMGPDWYLGYACYTSGFPVQTSFTPILALG